MHVSWKQCREETWAYTALAGIVSFHMGIVVGVFAFKGLVGDDSFSDAVQVIGTIISVAGVALVIASGVLYRRQRRHLRPCICCGEDIEAAVVPFPPSRRLRFAPNLVSPYYLEAVKADLGSKNITGNSDHIHLFETCSNDSRRTADSKDSSKPASERDDRSPSYKKEHRKTPC
ncbi:uncharacterized protein LOC121380124 [Gigantopelta aegis]|uniref:uncharacterized protein LOC121380124 n=1 Tax=Gigantopelta aegis TaxID=1735272 RepID=UPI001B88B4EE|nr:uncharacterized protein LOC121380124 [Gigantopelta aegis]XP_041364833.1 uncharacterized protein LOC121380124 [Gigantopelta aegis]XP_041364834.1 uncharacterized protein LOC121380124 [Gigantopelta aegis]XP_041364835.1 uncharacterized protein LOC121380124 [Gigantopelta aegis]XP_041364836.1 uncharacterized protein LOC121380124 [Gigantopelta aegis]XP_041364837.1 uncharacterized protein LOC121380124 [Gigantopelta aegis]XP_041364838.1 uncharacterized protein LOC121380124 [Gigantopelta aegis]XP_0